jgi:hypothetical protein
MVRWERFEREAPELAARGKKLIQGQYLAFLATVRSDGRPRLHPVCPVFADGGLYVATRPVSPKVRDLRSNEFYALHAMLGADDEEFLIFGKVAREESADTIEAMRCAAKHTIRTDDLIFEFLIEKCLWGVWENVGKPDTFAHRKRWVAS